MPYTEKDKLFIKTLKDQGKTASEIYTMLKAVKQREAQDAPTTVAAGSGSMIGAVDIPKPVPREQREPTAAESVFETLQTVGQYLPGAGGKMAAVAQVPETLAKGVVETGEKLGPMQLARQIPGIREPIEAASTAIKQQATGATEEMLRTKRAFLEQPMEREKMGMIEGLEEDVGRLVTQTAPILAPYLGYKGITMASLKDVPTTLRTIGEALSRSGAATTIEGLTRDVEMTPADYIERGGFDIAFDALTFGTGRFLDKYGTSLGDDAQRAYDRFRGFTTQVSDQSQDLARRKRGLLKSAMKGEFDAMDLVDDVDDVMRKFKTKEAVAYKKGEKFLKGKTMPKKTLQKNMSDMLETNYNITLDNGEITKGSFADSVFEDNDSIQKYITKKWNTLTKKPANVSATQINNLKKGATHMTAETVDASVKNNLRDVYRQAEDTVAPNFAEIKKRYAQAMDVLDELKQIKAQKTQAAKVRFINNYMGKANQTKREAFEKVLTDVGDKEFLDKVQALIAAEEFRPMLIKTGPIGRQRATSEVIGGLSTAGATGMIAPEAVPLAIAGGALTSPRLRLMGIDMGRNVRSILNSLINLPAGQKELVRKELRDIFTEPQALEEEEASLRTELPEEEEAEQSSEMMSQAQ